MTEELAPVAANDAGLVQLWLYNRSPDTQRAYATDVRRFLAEAGKSLTTVTLPDLQHFDLTLASLAPSSRYRILSSVKSLLKFGHRIGYLRFDTGAPLRLPVVRNRLTERILPEADVLRMLQAEALPRNRLILTLLYASGIRVSELCSLCWRDLQATEEAGQISVFGKGGADRSICLPEKLWKNLISSRHLEQGHDDPVFTSLRRGRPLKPLAVHRLVRAAARQAGIDLPVSPHWLRHAHASHALDRGAPIHLVQATLGHRNINTTGRYLHARPKESSSRFLAL